MTFVGSIPSAQILAFAGAIGGLIVVAYILRMRRRRFEVPFSSLWHRVLKETETTSLWRHLRRILSLLLLLFMAGLMIFAATGPRIGAIDADARSVVLIIDSSASMKTLDGEVGETRPPTDTTSRLDAAKEQAHMLVDSLGGGDTAMIMRMDGQTTPLSRFESDRPKLHRLIDGIEASDTPADLRRALGAASDALRERQRPLIAIIGDGAYPEETLDSVVWGSPGTAVAGNGEDSAKPRNSLPQKDQRLADIDLGGIDVRYLPVGSESENVGIVAFNVRRYIANKMAYEVYIETRNFGKKKARRKLVLYSGDEAVDVKTLELAPGEVQTKLYPDLSGGTDGRLRAVLVPLGDDPSKDDSVNLDKVRSDAFPLDDEAFALLPTRKKHDVLLVTANNLYLEGAMLVYENIRVDKLLPEEYEAAVAKGELDSYSAIVFDDFTPATTPRTPHLLYFNPTGEHSPFEISGSTPRPRITDTNDNHPVMRWLVLSDINFDKASSLRVDRDAGEVALITSVRTTIAAAKREGPRKIVALGFSLGGTDLMLRVAFPLLLVNTLDWFAGDDADLITTYTTGNRVRVPMDGTFGLNQVEVQSPDSRVAQAPLSDGLATFYANRVGVHRLTASDDQGVVATVELAANLGNPFESDIAPSAELNMGGMTLKKPDRFVASHSQSIWMYLVLLAALLLAIEWVTYNRRVTV